MPQIDPLPPAPRALNTRARRRSWSEPPVRGWMGLTIFVALSLIYLTAVNVRDALVDRNLIAHGIPASARLVDVAGNADPRKAVAMHGSTEDRTVHLSYVTDKGATIDSAERAIENPKYDGRRPGDTIQIRYDPNDPQIWTDRTEPQPWIARLTIVWMLLPVLVIALTVLLVRRRQMLAIWRDGAEASATVVELHHSSIAPRSRVVRFTLNDSDDRRIFSTFFPNAAGPIQKGDDLVVLVSPGNRSRVIVAELYEELNH